MLISNTTDSFQVIIIGCGPAAFGTSVFLSKLKIKHLILEKETFPRDKICGDACSGKTVFVLNKADPALLSEITENKDFLACNGICFISPNGQLVDIPFRPDPKNAITSGFIVKREHLDFFFYQKMKSEYAVILEGINVLELQKTDFGFTVHYEEKKLGIKRKVNSQILIGADGDKGITKKTLLHQTELTKTSSVGLRAYYEDVSGLHIQNHIELHFLKNTLPGYFWIFPLPNGAANVGIGMDSELIRKKKINLKKMFEAAINENENIKQRFQHAKLSSKIMGWGLPMSIGEGRISGEHFMLVGDAASLIDTFTGEGIGNALFSGMIAAEAIEIALKEERFSASFFKEIYDDQLYKRIGKELKISASLQKLVRYPWLFNFVMNKTSKSKTLQNTLTSMLADLDLREEFKKPSFYLKILFNK